MKRRGSNGRRLRAVGVALVALAMLAGAGAWGYGGAKITVNTLDEVLKGNPLPADKTAQVTWKSRAGNSELQVIEMSKIKLHHHDQEDHVLYVARGQGTARLADETRQVKAGDIISIPKGGSAQLHQGGEGEPGSDRGRHGRLEAPRGHQVLRVGDR